MLEQCAAETAARVPGVDAHLLDVPGPVDEDEDRTRVLGGLYQAMLIGVMVQWAVDPATAPTGPDIAAAIRALVADGAQP